MTFVELLVGALATWSALEVWHHGSLFARWRASLELYDNPLAYLLTRCMFCLSFWVALGVAGWIVAVRVAAAGELWLAPLYGLAVMRLANLGNDLTAFWCRTPRASAIHQYETIDDDPSHFPVAADPS